MLDIVYNAIDMLIDMIGEAAPERATHIEEHIELYISDILASMAIEPESDIVTQIASEYYSL